MPDTPLTAALPVSRNSGAILFDLTGAQLASVATEICRLTGQPLRFRWLSTADDDSDRVLVRVESPSELLVGRVLDGQRTSSAYTEQSPGIWVQLGVRIPPVPPVPAAGAMLLYHASGEFETIAPGDLVADNETIPLSPIVPTANGPTVGRLSTALRLTHDARAEPPRLWVLRQDALGQLAAFCRSTHQQLLNRFAAAVWASAGEHRGVLRALATKGPPPVFVGPAIACYPVSGLPNAFVPAGTRLAPALRRDAVRQAIGALPDRVVWLHPLDDGDFQVESLPESAFRPLSELVDYRVADAIRTTVVWSQLQRWEFDTFVERPEPTSQAVAVSPSNTTARIKTRRRGLVKRAVGWLKDIGGKVSLSPPIIEPPERTVPVEQAVRAALAQGDRLHLARPETVNFAMERCRALEASFLKDQPEGRADKSPERWAELAAAYDAAGNHADAALCWLNALWDQSTMSPLWAWGWLRSEAKAARPEVKAIDPLPWLAAVPGPGTTRAMAAWVVWASLQDPRPAALAERSADLQARFEAYEQWLPVRAAWLARLTATRLHRGDVLGLARSRDRLAERLHAGGLSLELDTPSFLRFAGEGNRGRFHDARRWLVDKRELIHQWIAKLPGEGRPRAESVDPALLRDVGLEANAAHTRAYADLILAWGLSRLAEHTAADTVRKAGVSGLPADDPVHGILRDAFEFRIARVRQGKSPHGPLPPAMLARLAPLTGQQRYCVDKLREYSRVLEPTARVEGFAEPIFRKAESRQALRADAVFAMPADQLDDRIGKLLAEEANREGSHYLAEVTAAALERASELTEPGVGSVCAILPLALDAARDAPTMLARLIEKGLAAAAAWDRPDLARDLAARFLQMLDGRGGRDAAEKLTGQAFRTLRRLGLKPDADHVLHHVAELVLRGQPLGKLRANRPAEWPASLRVLLHAAAGWYYAGRDEQAHAVLDEARNDLFAAETSAKDRTLLALTYAATLGQAPVRVALGRLEEVFQRLNGIAAGGSTNMYYSLNPLRLIETAVCAVVSDDFALGPRVRAWLDADELAVRRRIRDDLKAALAAQGL